MSDDLRTFAETKAELESEINFLDVIISEGSESKSKGGKPPSESLSKIPKGLVDARKRIYGDVDKLRRKSSGRKSVRFRGVGDDIEEEEGGEEENHLEDRGAAEQESGGESGSDGSGTESSSEDESRRAMTVSLDTDQKRSNLYLAEARARERNFSEQEEKKPPKFLPEGAFSKDRGRDEPLYVEPIDYGVKRGREPTREDPAARDIETRSKARESATALERSVGKLRTIWDNNQVDPSASATKNKRLDTIDIGINKWPGYGPFEALLQETTNFEFEFATESYTPYLMAKRKKEGSVGFIGTPDITGDLSDIKAMCLCALKMAMDERGNRDLLLVTRDEVAGLQETIRGLTRQIQNLSLEQSVLKATLSDLYVVLDRSLEEDSADGSDDVTTVFTKRNKTGRVTLDKVSGGSQSEKDKIYDEVYTKLKGSPLKASKLNQSETNATAFVPGDDPASVAVLKELVETDAVADSKKKFVRRMIGMARDRETFRVIHESIIQGRYK